MPNEPQTDDPAPISGDCEVPSDVVAARPPAPRVWTVFVAYVAALVGSIFVQGMAGVAVIAWQAAGGGDIQEIARDLPDKLTFPAGFMALGVLSQLTIGLAAIIPAWLSREPVLARLGLVRPNVPGWSYAVFAVGALVPLAVGITLAVALTRLIQPDPTVARLYEQMTWKMAVPFVLFITLMPGFMEEVLFRGFMQRRLLKRWSPPVAILVCSILFAIMHVTPHAVANALVIGLWLGVLAWRMGSVWPGIVCHAFINGSWNVWQIGSRLGVLPETPPVFATVIIGAVVVACFVLSIWLMRRPHPQAEVRAGAISGQATT
jgi:membrane protease YdiL (CAAX protease family)